MKFDIDIPVYGDTNFRGNCPPESAEQITFFNKMRHQYPDTYGRIAIHPRNEGKRSHQQTTRQKAEGMTKGASDIIIPGSPSFVCELKRRDHTKSKWEDGQKEYLEVSKDNGSFTCIALGCDAAWQAFNDWISNHKKAPN